MFDLFRKKPVLSGPHPLKVHFATSYLPMTIAGVRAGFINAMASDDAVGVLSRAWTKFGEANLPKKEVIEPHGLAVYVFREEDQVLIVISLPAPEWSGEPYFAAVVLGPPEGGEWTGESMAAVPFRYFVAFSTEVGTEIQELVGEDFVVHGPGPEPDVRLFVEWVMNEAVRTSGAVSVRSDDAEMEAAIEKAREQLPAVLEQFLAGELVHFTVKVRVSDGSSSEHFWLSNTEYVEGRFRGIIDAQPQRVEGITEGQYYEASTDEVTDWMHLRDGLMHGNHTLRVTLPRMPPSEAQRYVDFLAPLD